MNSISSSSLKSFETPTHSSPMSAKKSDVDARENFISEAPSDYQGNAADYTNPESQKSSGSSRLAELRASRLNYAKTKKGGNEASVSAMSVSSSASAVPLAQKKPGEASNLQPADALSAPKSSSSFTSLRDPSKKYKLSLAYETEGVEFRAEANDKYTDVGFRFDHEKKTVTK